MFNAYLTYLMYFISCFCHESAVSAAAYGPVLWGPSGWAGALPLEAPGAGGGHPPASVPGGSGSRLEWEIVRSDSQL